MRYEVSPAHREHAAPRGSAVPSSRARDCWSRKSTKQPRVVWPISASARTMTVFLARQARLECRAAPVVASGRRHLVTGNGTGLPLGVAAAARLFETAVRGGRHEIEFWAGTIATFRSPASAPRRGAPRGVGARPNFLCQSFLARMARLAPYSWRQRNGKPYARW